MSYVAVMMYQGAPSASKIVLLEDGDLESSFGESSSCCNATNASTCTAVLACGCNAILSV